MKLAMIVASSKNNVIGMDNQLPWSLPEDLRYFKKLTMGKPIIMGRKTFDSIGRPLPGRTNIVITRDSEYRATGCEVVSSLGMAINLASEIVTADDVDEALIIGGEQIYRLALDQVQRLYITKVHAEVEGDAYFPAVDASLWVESAKEDFFADETNPYDYSFVVYDRKV